MRVIMTLAGFDGADPTTGARRLYESPHRLPLALETADLRCALAVARRLWEFMMREKAEAPVLVSREIAQHNLTRLPPRPVRNRW